MSAEHKLVEIHPESLHIARTGISEKLSRLIGVSLSAEEVGELLGVIDKQAKLLEYDLRLTPEEIKAIREVSSALDHEIPPDTLQTVSGALDEQEKINQLRRLLQSISTATDELPRLNIEQVAQRAFSEIDELLKELKANGTEEPSFPLEKAVRLSGIIDLALSRPFADELLERTGLEVAIERSVFGKPMFKDNYRYGAVSLVIKKGGLYLYDYVLGTGVVFFKASKTILQERWDSSKYHRKKLKILSTFSPQDFFQALKRKFADQLK